MKTSWMQSHRIRVIAAITIVAAAALLWALWPRPLLVEIAPVTRGPYQQVIVEDGVTRAKEIYTVTSLVSGNMKRIQWEAGDKIKIGDVVAEFEWDRPVIIHSPTTGWVLRVEHKSGGPIERGDPIMEIADASSLEIVADVLTTDAVQIRPGDPVLIEDWGGDKPLEAHVRLIEPSAFKKISALGVEEQRVNVIIDITSPYAEWWELGDNYRVDAHIITFKTEDALTIPTGALFRSDGSWAVYKVVNGKARLHVIKVARHNPDRAMIAGGLQAGEQVIVYPNDEIKDGSRVRPFGP